MTTRLFAPTWESLTQHPEPAWLDEAKFGIYFHWGPYSVPAFGNEWYSRNMYRNGTREHAHHLATYGPLDRFGYKDFIPRFTGEHFNPQAWADLFVKAGARFGGPVAEHADGFAMWDSRLTKWNAARMGPKRDVVGEMERAIRDRGLKFFTSLHHHWLWAWYPTLDPRVDASNPNDAGLYGPPAPESAFWPTNDPRPDAAFCQRWLQKVNEVVDRYQPDLMYFDSRMFIIEERYRLEMLAHYYNRAVEWGREVSVTYKDNDLQPGAGIVDWERGRIQELSARKWTADDSIDWDSWCDVQPPHYKSVKRILDELIDIVSKNGIFILNICPRADGTIPEAIQERLLEVGNWLHLNGEAIYNTRPWTIYGEGPTRVESGHFSEKKIPDFTAQDIRFTVRGKTLYAIVCGWPENRRVTIRALHSGKELPCGQVGNVAMLGSQQHLAWQRDENGLTIELPDQQPFNHAVVLKVEGSPVLNN